MGMSEDVKTHKQRNYTPLIWVLSVIAVIIILGINYVPRKLGVQDLGFDLSILPLLNAILNAVAFILLLLSFIMIKRKNITAHRRLIYVAFGFTFVFLISYLTYHAFTGSTSYGDRKSTRLNSSHVAISYAVFCLKKKINDKIRS